MEQISLENVMVWRQPYKINNVLKNTFLKLIDDSIPQFSS